MRVHSPSSLREDAIWATLGSAAQAGAQFALLVAMTRWLTPEWVGVYALAQAIATPLHVFADRALRTLQATATDGDSAIEEYLLIRATLAGLALLAIAGAVLLWHRETAVPGLFSIAMLVAVQRGLEGLAQTLYGRWEQARRVDEVGRSLILRALVTTATAVGVLGAGADLALALMASTMVQAGVLLGWDLRRYAWLQRQTDRTWSWHPAPARSLANRQHWYHWARRVAPLASATFLVAWTASLPRLFLARVGNVETLGRFAVLCYLCFPAGLLVSALMQAATPRLARTRVSEPERYRGLVLRLMAIVSVLATANGLILTGCGAALIARIFGETYVGGVGEVSGVALAFGVSYLANVPGAALVAQRSFRLALLPCVVACLAGLLVGGPLVRGLGIHGGAGILLVTSSLHLIGSAVGWWWSNRDFCPAEGRTLPACGPFGKSAA